MDSQTKIINAAINKYFCTFISFTQNNWVNYLLFAKFATNNQINKNTSIFPFFVNYGFNPCLRIKPAGFYPPTLSIQAKKEFFCVDSIANCFKQIMTQFKALAQIS